MTDETVLTLGTLVATTAVTLFTVWQQNRNNVQKTTEIAKQIDANAAASKERGVVQLAATAEIHELTNSGQSELKAELALVRQHNQQLQSQVAQILQSRADRAEAVAVAPTLAAAPAAPVPVVVENTVDAPANVSEPNKKKGV